MGKQETLETIWEVPDELWERIEPIILEEDRSRPVKWCKVRHPVDVV